MPTTTSSRGGIAARTEVLEMLKADHRKAKKAFKDFEKLDPEQDAEQCQAIVEETCGDLRLHMRLEEECFYPATREALDEEDQIDEAEVEHASCKQLIEQLRGMSPEDEKFAARFKVLGEYINHHVKEEEGAMFPEVSKKKLDWQQLLDEMKSRRQELMQEENPEAALLEDEDDAEAAASTQAGAGKAQPGRAPASARTRESSQRAQAASDGDEEE